MKLLTILCTAAAVLNVILVTTGTAKLIDTDQHGDLYFVKLKQKTNEVFRKIDLEKFASTKDRRSAVINSLKTFTAASQKNVLSILEESKKENLVSSYEQLWLINEILVRSPDQTLIQKLLETGQVESVTKDYVYYAHPSTGYEWADTLISDTDTDLKISPTADCTEPSPDLPCTTCTQTCNPNDLWGRAYINVAAAHQVGATGQGVRVGIIDTGCYRTHIQYQGRLRNDIWLDPVSDGECPYDDNGHGTHCSGIAVGTDTGVAIDAELICCKNMNSSGYTALSRDIQCVQFMVQNDVGVCGNSYYTDFVPGDSYDALWTAVNNSVEAGLVYVASQGNDGCDGSTAPGNFSSVIGVGSIDASNRLSSFSSCLGKKDPINPPNCTSLDDQDNKPSICAPGRTICSCWPNSNSPYRTISGTSMAGPFVTGVVALLLEVNPNLTPQAVKGILCSSAQMVNSEPTCSAMDLMGDGSAIRADQINQCCGWGGLDAAQAVQMAYQLKKE